MTNLRGFTLLELMFVLTIIYILTAISYPTYQAYILRSQNAIAQASLLEISTTLERYYAEHNTYNNADKRLIFSLVVPTTGEDKTHDITLEINANGHDYTLTAIHITDASSIYSINSSGLRSQGLELGWER